MSDGQLSESELERYSRHLVIPEVGISGQQKLKNASVLVIGAGGLGSPVIQYLAAAGIGKIGVVDFDRVDRSNLQRQVLFQAQDVERFKTDAARERALKLNPEISVVEHRLKLDADNVAELFSAYSIIVDGSDNFETRYLISDACVLLGKINVHGAVHRFDGQVSVFSPFSGPCYRCVFSEAPEPGAFLNCAEAGVLGVLPGIVGSIQATECLKLVLAIGTPLIGKLLLIDALDMTFRTVNLSRNPQCITCGESPEIATVSDLQAKHANVAKSCSAESKVDSQALAPRELAPKELARALAERNKMLLVDVRENNEFSHSHLDKAVNFPLSRLSERIKEIPTDADVIVYCKSGARSMKAAEMLRQAGIKNVRNLSGGLSAWSKQVDASMSVL